MEKEWIDCVKSDIQAFGIAGDWEVTALEAEEACGLRQSRQVRGGLWSRGGKKR